MDQTSPAAAAAELTEPMWHAFAGCWPNSTCPPVLEASSLSLPQASQTRRLIAETVDTGCWGSWW
jgi:hypothetical protein